MPVLDEKRKGTFFNKIVHFVRYGIWEFETLKQPWLFRQGIYLIRMGTLVVNGVRRGKCTLRAASLTFFSLMALIPVLVLTLVMARAFGGAELAKEQIYHQIDSWMAQMEEAAIANTTEVEGVPGDTAPGETESQKELTQAFSAQVREIADQLFTQIDQIGFGTLGGVGAVMLLWTVISVLGKVEVSFNEVWGIEKPRTLVRKFADYLAVIMILPFLVTAVSTVPVAAHITRLMDQTVGGSASDSFRALLRSGAFKTAVTLVTGTLTFAFLLGFMPNTRVKTMPALIGGGVTAILFGGWLKLCAMLQIGIAKYSALYGGFAVLPILLMWVYTSWQIVLLGAELAFAVQNRDTYMVEKNAANASPRARILMALALCRETALRAKGRDGGPFNAQAFARKHGVARRFAMDILEDLLRQGILAEVHGQPGEYLLCRCAGTITAAEIARAMLDDGAPLSTLGLRETDAETTQIDIRLNQALEQHLGMTLVAEAQGRMP